MQGFTQKGTFMDMTKAIAYVRVSTEGQAVDGVSIDAQVDKIKAYASLYDIELLDVVVEVGSGKNITDRPKLQGVLNALSEGKAEALVIYRLDRLTRSVSDLGGLLDGYFVNQSVLLSVSEQIDTRSAAGRLVLNVLASVGQWERETISERTKQAMQFMRSNNQYTGGRPPYGFDLVEGKLVKNEGEQKVLSVVRQCKDNGMSIKNIVQELTGLGFKSRNGKPFYYAQVRRLAA